MKILENLDSLMVCQQKEWGEIVTGFETKNKYAVSDEHGQQIYFAAEQKGSLLARLFLKANRPFYLAVLDEASNVVISVTRPFRFYFHQATICDAQGKVLGVIKKEFSLLRRTYAVFDSSDREIFQLHGPMLKPWTFLIKNGDRELGKITKQWSGLLKESFTDADNFGVTFPIDWPVANKALFLGAVFLIDFVHFENND
ncbi:MAG: scramblase [Psychrobium sp.]|nr:scramblase [Psychrobium sp.]